MSSSSPSLALSSARLKLSASESEILIGGSKLAKIAGETTKTRERLQAEVDCAEDIQLKINSLLQIRDDLSHRMNVLQSLAEAQRPVVPKATVVDTAALSRPLMAQMGSTSMYGVPAPDEQAAVMVYNDINSEEPSKGIMVSSTMSPTEVIETALRKFRFTANPNDVVFVEVTDRGEAIVEENLVLAKKRLEQSGVKNYKFFLTKRRKEGMLTVVFEGEGEKGIPVSNFSTVEEVVAALMKRSKDPSADPSRFKFSMTSQGSEQVLGPSDRPFELHSRARRRGETGPIKFALKDKSFVSAQPTPSPFQPQGAPVAQQGVKAKASLVKQTSSTITNKQQLQALKEVPENDACAECGGSQVEYVSLNLGIFLCRKCARVHVSLSGTQTNPKGAVFVSKVRPAYYFPWPQDAVQVMKAVGNANACRIWEENISFYGVDKPSSFDSVETKNAFMQQKYASMDFVETRPPEEAMRKLLDAVKAKDILGVYEGLASSAEYYKYADLEGRTLLHLAVISGFAPVISLVVSAGLNPCALDASGRTPLYYGEQLKRDDLVHAVKAAQVVFEAAIRHAKRPEIAGVGQGLAKLADEEFRNLFNDVLNEVDRRVVAGGTPAQGVPGGTDGAQRLARLELVDFLSLAQTVFEEQNYRENALVYASVSKPDADPNWAETLRRRQDSEAHVSVFRPADAPKPVTQSRFFAGAQPPPVIAPQPEPADFGISPTASPPSPISPSSSTSGYAAPTVGYATPSSMSGSMAYPAAVALPPPILVKAVTASPAVVTVDAAPAPAAAPAAKSPAKPIGVPVLPKGEAEPRAPGGVGAKKPVFDPVKAEAERREAQERAAFEEMKRGQEEMERIAREKIRQREEERRREEEERRREEACRAQEQQRQQQQAVSELDELDLIEEEFRRQLEELDAETGAETAKIRQQQEEEDRRRREERERAEAEQRVRQEALRKKQEEDRLIMEQRRAEEERIAAARREEEERQNALELKRLQDEQRRFMEEMEREEQRQREEKARQDAAATAQSLEEIMMATMRIEEEKRQQQERLIAERRKRQSMARMRHDDRLRQLTDEAVGTVKAFVMASSSNKPGIFYESFVPVATSAHSLAEYSDLVVGDPDVDEARKPLISLTAERLMKRVKELMEAVKTAARLFPNEEALNTMRVQAFELVKTIKELVMTMSKAA